MKTTLTDYPSEMRALVLSEFGENPKIQQMEVPKPGKGEIIIKMDNSPVNPSDIMFLKGMYSTKKKLPVSGI